MMKNPKRRALALALMLAPHPALADEIANPNQEIIALGNRADQHGPSGTMADHVHKAGELMIDLTWMHEEAGGANRRGTAAIDDASIVTAGYTARAQSMTMDMAMLHIMYAPADRVTLMVVPSWQRMDMTMIGIAPSGHGSHGGHALAVGDTMTHRVSGFGDTQIAALVSLSRRPALSVHAGLALSVPTGSVSRRGEDGKFVHYGMQPGSGTWDLNPSLTLRGAGRGFGWGLQSAYLFRTAEANRSGFRFGDRFTATAWLSRPFGEHFSLSTRLAWSDEGKVSGHYSSGHKHASPADRQANYGGRRLDAGLGVNLTTAGRLRFGLEASVPLYQDLNGIQAPRQFATSLNVSRKF